MNENLIQLLKDNFHNLDYKIYPILLKMSKIWSFWLIKDEVLIMFMKCLEFDCPLFLYAIFMKDVSKYAIMKKS